MRLLVGTVAGMWLVAWSDPLRSSEVVVTYLLASMMRESLATGNTMRPVPGLALPSRNG
jgi:hypothetical protein